MVRSAPLFFFAGLAACAAPTVRPPLLTPRAAEAIDPRLPVVHPSDTRPAGQALAGRLADLVAQARSGDSAFRSAIAQAERMASAAGAPQGDGWVAAQQALTVAVAAKGPTTRALADIDALGADRLKQQGGIAPGDFAAIQAALAEVGAIDSRQAGEIDRLQVRLGR